jgi:hypothetical protein
MKKIILFVSIFISGLFAQNISTYLTSDMQSKQAIEESLTKAGFEVLSTYDAMQDSNYQVISYTSKELKQLASKDDRGFAAVQKVLLSKNTSKLVFTNPQYYLQAMLQDDFDANLASKVTTSLNNAFTLKQGSYNLDENDLSSYHFMFGMPYYEDMIEVAQGENLEELLLKNASNNIVFKTQLDNAVLYGISMQNEQQYIPLLKQEESSAFLPYMVLIQNNKAKILAPKYYLALSLPQLTMGEFMTISDIPGIIEEHFISLFNQ